MRFDERQGLLKSETFSWPTSKQMLAGRVHVLEPGFHLYTVLPYTSGFEVRHAKGVCGTESVQIRRPVHEAGEYSQFGTCEQVSNVRFECRGDSEFPEVAVDRITL